MRLGMYKYSYLSRTVNVQFRVLGVLLDCGLRERAMMVTRNGVVLPQKEFYGILTTRPRKTWMTE